MAGYAGAGDLGVINHSGRGKLDRGVAGIARVRRRHMRLRGSLQLAQDWPCRNSLGAIMARQATADDLRVIDHGCGFEEIGVVAGIACIRRCNMRRWLADRGVIVVTRDAVASKAWLRVVRLGIGNPRRSADMAIPAVLCGRIEDRVGQRPDHGVGLAGIMAC